MLSDEKIKEEFEKWLRSYCFQAPPERDYQLMKDACMETGRIIERLAKIEVLEKVIEEYGFDIGGLAYNAIRTMIAEIKDCAK